MNKIITDPNLVFNAPLYMLDGSSFMDKSAYGHTCTVTGATWGMQGRTFNGTNTIIDAPVVTTNIYGISMELWFKSDVDPQVGDAELFGIGTNVTGYGVFCANVGGVNWVRVLIHGIAWSGDKYIPAVDEWVHTAFTLSYLSSTQVTTSHYINGNILWSGAMNNPNTPTAQTRLGASGEAAPPANNYFDGLIGEARVYNRALTPQEIQRNYLLTKWRYA